jgi:hypothetical protein
MRPKHTDPTATLLPGKLQWINAQDPREGRNADMCIGVQLELGSRFSRGYAIWITRSVV